MSLPRRWWLPSLTAWLWLVILVVLLSAAWRVAMVSADGDACMHWACGEWMLQNRQLLDHDVFSHTRPGEPIISKEWLAQIISAGVARLDGLAGIAALGALLLATTFALLHRQLLREGNDLFTATVVTVLSAWAAQSHWLARPHLWSLLLFALWNATLRRNEAGRTARLWMLPVLTVVWVNLHGGFLTGFFLLGGYWLGAVWERDWSKLRHYTRIGLLCGVASFANPSGYKLHLHNLAFVRNEFFTNWLAEYLSPNFHSPSAHSFLVLLLVLLLVLALVRPHLTAHETLLLAMWGYFALYSGRNIPLFAIVAAPILSRALSAALPARLRPRVAGWQELDVTAGGWPVIGAATVALFAFYPRPTAMPADKFPIEAIEYIRAHPQKFTGPMFNQYLWGGYLLVALPEHKVFVDGRADFYGEALVREFDDTTHLQSNWYAPLEKYNIRWSLMPTDHYLNLALERRGWERVYHDAVATIYCR